MLIQLTEAAEKKSGCLFYF